MILPKFRETVEIRFWSLRNGVGESLGIIHDIDTLVERYCYRVKDEDSWRWQIRGLKSLHVSDWYAETDQECLDNLGSDLDFEII